MNEHYLITVKGLRINGRENLTTMVVSERPTDFLLRNLEQGESYASIVIIFAMSTTTSRYEKFKSHNPYSTEAWILKKMDYADYDEDTELERNHLDNVKTII